jgi:hypothetical protein
MHRSPIMIAALLLAPVIGPVIAAEARTISPVEEVDAKFRKAMIEGDVEALKSIIADDAKISTAIAGVFRRRTD